MWLKITPIVLHISTVHPPPRSCLMQCSYWFLKRTCYSRENENAEIWINHKPLNPPCPPGSLLNALSYRLPSWSSHVHIRHFIVDYGGSNDLQLFYVHPLSVHWGHFIDYPLGHSYTPNIFTWRPDFQCDLDLQCKSCINCNFILSSFVLEFYINCFLCHMITALWSAHLPLADWKSDIDHMWQKKTD